MNVPPVAPNLPSLKDIFSEQAANARKDFRQHWESRVAEGQAALDRNPLDSEAYLDLAYCFTKLQQHEKVLALLEQGLERCPRALGLHESLINQLEGCNQTEAAIAAAQTALRLFPENMWFRLKEALLLPLLYSTETEIENYRTRFTQALDKLAGEIALDTPGARSEALSAIGNHVNVGLGYQVKDDRRLQAQYGELVHRIMAANYPEFASPIPMPPPSPDGKLRIGYVSGRFRDLSATKCFLGWITRHSRSNFELFAYHLGRKTDAVTAQTARAIDHFRHLTGSIEETGRMIRADQLHILVYLDIGLTPALTQLGAMRLAPIQCLTWDQPITSGLPTMDYFISSALMEPADAAEHYSERLICLPGVGVCFQKPVIPTMLLAKDRRDFGLRENAVVYLCCQAAYKYLPQHDDVFVQIAQRVPNSQFVFLPMNRFVASDLQKRLDRAFATAGLNAVNHCVFLAETGRFSYWNLSLVSDVFLDTIGWSGGVSTVEAIACHLPVVTLPGNLMRSNHSSAILTQLGATETIARDKTDYVRIASRLGLDSTWRQQVVRHVEQDSPALYSDERCVSALEDFYQQAALPKFRSQPQ